MRRPFASVVGKAGQATAALAISLLLPGITPSAQAAGPGTVTCTVDVTYYPAGAPAGFDKEVDSVLREASLITGISFRQATGQGSKPVDVVARRHSWSSHIAIVWDSPDRHQDVKFHGKLGVALMNYARGSIDAVTIVLNSEKLNPGSYQMGGKTYATGPMVIPGDTVTGKAPVGSKNLLRHELGHALGLDHVTGDPSSIMTPYLTQYKGPSSYTADARTSLRSMYQRCRTP